MAPVVGTVVRIQQTANGWKPVKTAVAVPSAPASNRNAPGMAKAVSAAEPKKAAAGGAAAPRAAGTAASSASKAAGAAKAKAKAKAPAAAPAAAGPSEGSSAPKPVARGLLALAKRRSFVEVEEEQEAQEDSQEEDEEQAPPQEEAAPPPAKVAKVQGTGPGKTKLSGLALLAKKKSEQEDAKWDEEEEQEEGAAAPAPGAAKVGAGSGSAAKKGAGAAKAAPRKPVKRGSYGALNLNVSYSGVVTETDLETGDFVVECPPVTSAIGEPAVIIEEHNPGGVRIGSIVCFKVARPPKGPPLATEVVINGFDDTVVEEDEE